MRDLHIPLSSIDQSKKTDARHVTEARVPSHLVMSVTMATVKDAWDRGQEGW